VEAEAPGTVAGVGRGSSRGLLLLLAVLIARAVDGSVDFTRCTYCFDCGGLLICPPLLTLLLASV
jgi:hypothetical protein